AEIKGALNQERGTIRELFKPGLRIAMVVGIFLALFSQITGINAIIYYAPEIFKSVGFGTYSAFSQTILIGVVNTIFTLVALVFIDKAGSRTLLLWGLAGMMVCLLGVAVSFYFNFTND